MDDQFGLIIKGASQSDHFQLTRVSFRLTTFWTTGMLTD